MTIEWRYTIEPDLGILSVAGHLGQDAAHRFTGAVGWVLARGTGPVIVDCTELRGWSVQGQLALAEAARRLAAHGRRLELAAIPADGSLVPVGDCPPIPVHGDLTAALAAHQTKRQSVIDGPEGPRQEWRTGGWSG
ncbi:STAS domain-containing protein [Streptomyces sp. NRRL B-1347]|uniref:STAS domain-containing protein n=1 Tax=Streptomyces sp. NRRL B-1347 TaxID=1476877 RepID=UPI0004C96150|nr:STAS domain-containing protein [Streptomyces sp. NRRL B-1347]